MAVMGPFAAVGESRSHWSASAQRTSRRRPSGDQASERSVPVVVNTGRSGHERRGRDVDAVAAAPRSASAIRLPRGAHAAAPTRVAAGQAHPPGALARHVEDDDAPGSTRQEAVPVGRPRQRRHRADAAERAPHQRPGVDVADLDAPARADPRQRVRRAGAPRRRHRPHGLGEDPRRPSRRRPRRRARRRGGRRSGSRRATTSRRAPSRARRSSTPRARSAPPRSARDRARRPRRARAATTSPPSTARAAAASRPRARSTSPATRRRAAAPAGSEPSDARRAARSRTPSPRTWRTHRGGSAATATAAATQDDASASAITLPRRPTARRRARERWASASSAHARASGAGGVGERRALEAIAQRAHRSTTSCSPSSPRRSRELTVPRGSPSAEAISPGVKPSRWRMTMTARWSGGSADRAREDVVARRVGAIERRRLDARVGHLAPQLARAGVVDGAVDDDAVKPRAERPAAIEAVERADGGQERLLGDVLGRGRVVQHEPRRPVGARPMAAEELGEGLGSSRAARPARATPRTRATIPGAGRRPAASRATVDTPAIVARTTPLLRARHGEKSLPSCRAVQPEFLPPDPYAEAPPAPQPASRPVFLPPDAARRGHRAAPEQQGRLGADLRLGQPRPARLQRRPALLPHPSRLDRRLGPRQPGQARAQRRAIRPTSRSSSPSSA